VSELTIRTLEVTPVLVPLRHPVKTASGAVTHAPLILIDLHTEFGGVPGPTGHTYVFAYTPLALKPLWQLLQALTPQLEGLACCPSSLHAKLRRQFILMGYTGIVGMALAGIDMAMWDACAKMALLPLSQLLGAQPRALRSYASHGMEGRVRGVELAEQALDSGFSALKIKIGYPTLEEDLDVVGAVRAAVGKGVDLMVDYNQSLSINEAMRRCHALDALALAWIEEPTAQDDFLGHAQLARELNTPIQMGENWYGVSEMAQCVATKGCDLVMPDVMKIGGVTGWQQAATLAAAHSLPMSSHLFQEVSAHLLCASPTAHWLEHMGLADPILQRPLKAIRGYITPNSDPGSGVAWDVDAVARFRID
jgi:mandelate racemase